MVRPVALEPAPKTSRRQAGCGARPLRCSSLTYRRVCAVVAPYGRASSLGLARSGFRGWLSALVALAACALAGGCVEIAGYGPERTLAPALPYFQDAEATSGAGRCDQERPPFRSRVAKPVSADCDATQEPLSGSQSISIAADSFLLCDPCWEASSEIWARFLFRAVAQAGYAALPFTPLFTDSRGDLVQPATGPTLAWQDSETEGAAIRVHCPNTGARSDAVPLPTGETRVITFHFDAPKGAVELWVQPPGSGPPSGAPNGSASCLLEGEGRISGWLARGNIKLATGGGRFSIDDIRVTAGPPQ